MTHFFRPLLRFLFHLGYFGPLAMGVLDSSFLFLPFGNDILVVALVARHHDAYLIYVLSASVGSTLGVLLLDIVARRIGESGVQKVAGRRRFDYLRRKIEKHGALAILVACFAPPPFPFTMAIAINSALGFPRLRLLLITAAGRAIRFLILGSLAIYYGRHILRMINSDIFRDVMIGFTILCLAGSAVSIANWIRTERKGRGCVPPDSKASPSPFWRRA